MAHITLKKDETQRQPISEKVDVKERIVAIEEEEPKSPRSITAVTQRRSTRDQIRALRDVARRTDDTAADEVMAILTNTECESEVRTAAARALGSCWNAMAVDTLITLIGDSTVDSEIRCGSAYALGAIKDSRALEPLIAVLREPDSDTRLRCSAALALGEMGDFRAVPVLKSGRWTADVGLRVSIGLALTKINALASDRTRTPTSEA
jgi:HEAT repeat protein